MADSFNPAERTKAQLQTTTPAMRPLRIKDTTRGENFKYLTATHEKTTIKSVDVE